MVEEARLGHESCLQGMIWDIVLELQHPPKVRMEQPANEIKVEKPAKKFKVNRPPKKLPRITRAKQQESDELLDQ